MNNHPESTDLTWTIPHTGACGHLPSCPSAEAADREAARLLISHPQQGWGLLCNGVVVFDDTGELLPDGRAVAPHRAAQPGRAVCSGLVCVAAAASAGPTGFFAGLAAMRSRLRRVSGDAAHARWIAEHDALTGLPNRSAARHLYQTAAQEGRSQALVLLDLDDFKTVNDTWGHHVGDALLVAVAERLAGSCRGVGATACRLGGDEFLLLIPAGDGGEAAVRQVAGIVLALGAALPLTVDEVRTIVTHPGASAGVAVAGEGETFSDALRHADIALYHAKRDQAGPCLFRPDLRQPASHRHKAGDLLGLHGMGHAVGGPAESVQS